MHPHLQIFTCNHCLVKTFGSDLLQIGKWDMILQNELLLFSNVPTTWLYWKPKTLRGGGTNIGNLDLKLQSPLPSPLSPPLLHFPHEKENNNSNTKTDTIQSANIVQIQKIKDSFLVGNWRHLSFVKISTLVWVVLLDQN